MFFSSRYFFHPLSQCYFHCILFSVVRIARLSLEFLAIEWMLFWFCEIHQILKQLWLSQQLILFAFFTHHFAKKKRLEMQLPLAKLQLNLKMCRRVTSLPDERKWGTPSDCRSVFSSAYLIPTPIKYVVFCTLLPCQPPMSAIAGVQQRRGGGDQTMICPQKMKRNQYQKTGVCGMHFCAHRLTFNYED